MSSENRARLFSEKGDGLLFEKRARLLSAKRAHRLSEKIQRLLFEIEGGKGDAFVIGKEGPFGIR